ncbi:hypothetical protein GYMLUDRAFT_68809 [Collybiopsis luxurians FD-317 M1]|nr:hypothetical protein GYMLUDRAFT_68809 [Collybiopsis luxurians FD-317 M1]
MQVTISLLPVSLSLVRVPRSRLVHLSSPIIRQILQARPTFLNFTCNEIELSIFAEASALDEFEVIARRDRQKQRSRSGSGSSRKSFTDPQSIEPVEFSYEKWSVLQIDSHSDALDNAGARVYELSAPLAAAGISILYQSSYLSDFIFVKEARLQEVISLFSSAGFDLYSEDLATHSLLSPPPSPLIDSQDGSDAPSSAVLTRTRPPDAVSSVNDSGSQTPSRTKSHSPTSGDVCILGSDLACVGLSDDHVDHWSLKIIKLIAFPDLIPSSKGTFEGATPNSRLSSSARVDLSARRFSHARSSSDDSSLKCGSSSSASDDDDDEEGYYSHSPTTVSENDSTSSSASPSISESTGPSYPPLASPSSHRPPSKHLMGPLSPLSPIATSFVQATSISNFSSVASLPSQTRKFSRSGSSSSGRRPSATVSPKVPFFSITRTLEGTSFTTDVDLLARLFPSYERYMVVCGGELDAADERLARQEAGEEDEDQSGRDAASSAEEAELDAASGLMKCLQIDLRKFGLDKHGLVNRFSRVLEENGINHMHSSTYKTANLLVGKRHAARAQAILRAC